MPLSTLMEAPEVVVVVVGGFAVGSLVSDLSVVC